MSTNTSRLGLKKPEQPDPFLATDFASNYDKLDQAPGIHVCTTGTRPAWGAAQAGRTILETDTRNQYLWTGTEFVDSVAMPFSYSGYTAPSGLVAARSTVVDVPIMTSVVTRKPGILVATVISQVTIPATAEQEVSMYVFIDGTPASPNGKEITIRTVNSSFPGFYRHILTDVGSLFVNAGTHSIMARFVIGLGPPSVTINSARTSAILTSVSR